MRKILQKIMLLAGGVASGCSNDVSKIDSEFVYVPGPDFKQELKISTSSQDAVVGDELVLTAERASSGFVKIKASEYKRGCYFVSEPPRVESDASLNVTWLVTPKGKFYKFSVSDGGNRTVSFTKPGKYTLKAHSALWCPPGIDGNEIVISVVE